MSHTTPNLSRAGFSLVELMMSLVITSVLMLGLSSVILIGSRAIPTGDEPIHDEANVSQVLDEVVANLEMATLITKIDTTFIWFEIPDRDGDGKIETVGYQFDTDSNAFRSRWNSDPVTVLIENVGSCTLSATTENGATSKIQIKIEVKEVANPIYIAAAEMYNNPETK